jgi:hypothetical protein
LVPTSAEEGVKTPEALTPFPDHVPPAGVPLRVTGCPLEHVVWDAPAETVTEEETVIILISVLVQPFSV